MDLEISEFEPLPIQVGKYRLDCLLGAGEYGGVFLAFDSALEKEKAVKVLALEKGKDPQVKLAEAQLMLKCKHKNIVVVNEANVVPHRGRDYIFLDLEYIKRGSLQAAMEKKWLSVKSACSHMSEVLSGLSYAHEQGVLHRDIKPGNILLGDESTKLSDFGLATSAINLVGSDDGYQTHLAPEYYLTRKTTHLTDIYAAGMTLYRLVVNAKDWAKMVYPLPGSQDLIKKGLILQALGYPGFVSKKVSRIISKACHKDPLKRYQSALKMRQDLDSLRHAVEWEKAGDLKWIGKEGSNSYELSATKGRDSYSVTYSKNGRRESAKCKRVQSESEALRCMAGIVQEESFL